MAMEQKQQIPLIVERSEATEDEIIHCVEEIEKLECRYGKAATIAQLFDGDALQKHFGETEDDE